MTKARIKGRGANVVVQAYGQVLFKPGGQVNRWNRKFTNTVKRKVRDAAPVNKRPKWSHYGKPLKKTIMSAKPRVRIYASGARIYAAVGASAPHAYYVDQGTKGYYAKILPPWTRGGASLYEHTWKVPVAGDGTREDVRWEEIGKVWVGGQRGQAFFARGLQAAFLSMRLQRNVPAPAKIVSAAVAGAPEGITNFLGNTKDDGEGGAFRLQLEEWRRWRDAAWNSGRLLGRNGGIGNPEWVRRLHRDRARGMRTQEAREISASARRAKNAQRKRESRERLARRRPERMENRARAVFANRKAAERARFLAAAIKKYGQGNLDMDSLTFEGGYWYILVLEYTKREGDGQLRPSYREIRGRLVE